MNLTFRRKLNPFSPRPGNGGDWQDRKTPGFVEKGRSRGKIKAKEEVWITDEEEKGLNWRLQNRAFCRLFGIFFRKKMKSENVKSMFQYFFFCHWYKYIFGITRFVGKIKHPGNHCLDSARDIVFQQVLEAGPFFSCEIYKTDSFRFVSWIRNRADDWQDTFYLYEVFCI